MPVDDYYESEVISPRGHAPGGGTTMSVNTTANTITYPAEGLGAPKDRRPGPLAELGLPAGTEVFSADDHISLSQDIFYENFPAALKDQAPRVMNVDGGWVLGFNGTSIL